jgi:hypothetical protein
VVRRHKQRLRDYLRGLAAEAGAGDPDVLAEQLLALVDGATVTAMVTPPGTAAARAAGQAAALLTAACRG